MRRSETPGREWTVVRLARLVLIALCLTLLSVFVPSSQPGFAGNVCGPDGQEPCPVVLRRGGWPWPYVTENPNASPEGDFGFIPDDHWSGWTFALDTAFHIVLLVGASTLRQRDAARSA